MDNYFCNNQGIIISILLSFPHQDLQHYLHTRTESLIPGVSGPWGEISPTSENISHIGWNFRKRLNEILGSEEESHSVWIKVYAQR